MTIRITRTRRGGSVKAEWDHRGCSRSTLLIGRWAVKVPSVQSDWNHFLLGMLGNDREARLSAHDRRFCPVIWAAPLGLALVMPRAQVLEDLNEADRAQARAICDIWPNVELKANSFGHLSDGTFVCLDYG